MSIRDEPDERDRCPNPDCAQTVHVEPASPYEQERTGKALFCAACSTYFGTIGDER